MVGEVIKADFGSKAQNRDYSFVPDIKEKSDIVAEMSQYHAEIRMRNGWRSTVTRQPHRYIIFSYTQQYGLEPIARCSIDTAQELIDDIQSSSEESLLAVTSLEKSFEAQWPRNKTLYSIDQLAEDPIDLRFKDKSDVVLAFAPLHEG